MKVKSELYIIIFAVFLLNCGSISSKMASGQEVNFDVENDFLLLNYDCKTDVDDLHSIAAFASLLTKEKYSRLNFMVVPGTYGIQTGKYVPPNSLIYMICPYQYADAHEDFEKALGIVESAVNQVLKKGGDLWIAEAGQSDFSMSLVQLLKTNFKKMNIKERIHIVQHSDWNESVTTPNALNYVKEHTNYIKIADGNTVDNGTPGFNCEKQEKLIEKLQDENLKKIWKEAIRLSDLYNGTDDRYLNKNIMDDGLDFSDFAEVHRILGLQELRDCSAFIDFVNGED